MGRALALVVVAALFARAGDVRVTFARDVAPILYRSCVECHRPGEVAPFSLLSYADAARRAKLIAEVTRSRYMPPWKPAAGYGDFAGARGLSDAEIRTIQQWAAGGAPGGDPKSLPPAPRSRSGWKLEKPDLVVQMPKPFAVPADGPDLYRCFVIPLGLTGARYVRSIEFRPDNPRVTHHALLFADRAGLACGRESEPGSGYECFGTPGFLPAAGLGGWTPGSPPIRMPEGVSEVLTKDTSLVVQLHFHPTGKPETQRTSIAFAFTGKPPERRLMDVALGSRRIDIPPGEKDYRVTDHFTLPVAVQAIGIIPHAHYICKDMRGTAVLPGGTRRWLIWIRDWDFNWQEQYKYRNPIHLPAGTRLEMEFTYDNSAGNPRNPNQPPKRVVWGPGSADEMAGLHLQVIPERASDAAELGQALWGKLMRSVGGAFYRGP